MAIDYKTHMEIEKAQFRNLTGEEAIDAMYADICVRYKDPKTQKEFHQSSLFKPEFERIFGLYFRLHPKEAERVVKEHDAKFTGIRILLRPLAYLFQDHISALEYSVAKQRIAGEQYGT
jgi:hypothetical protein